MSNYGKSTFGLDANLVALLCYLLNIVCYLGLILSILTVIQDKNNRLARFHAWQSILGIPFGIVLGIILGIGIGIAAAIDGAIGFPLFSAIVGILGFVVSLAFFIYIVMAAVKGYGGEEYKIPVIGNIAEKMI